MFIQESMNCWFQIGCHKLSELFDLKLYMWNLSHTCFWSLYSFVWKHFQIVFYKFVISVDFLIVIYGCDVWYNSQCWKRRFWWMFYFNQDQTFLSALNCNPHFPQTRNRHFTFNMSCICYKYVCWPDVPNLTLRYEEKTTLPH